MQVRDALWSFEPLLTTPAGARENAILVLHELVSNIVEHAGTVGEVHVRYDGDVVAFRVIDLSPQLPHSTTAPDSAPRSGLDVVAALSRDWGDVARTSERLAALLHARADGQADPQRAGELRRAAARAEEFAREERAAARHWRSRYRHGRQ